ncbi:MAG: endolytic transglycosylase MltG [Acidocella sp.]|nr:endolytic transglycosylase MltG [Acidocella sp.]
MILPLCALLLVLSLGKMALNETLTAPSDFSSAKTVVIPAGGTAEAADTLVQAGVVRYPLVFRAAAWFTRHQGHIHAGEFLIPAHASLQQLLNILRFGAVVQHQVTIPEGLTGRQIAKIINAAPAASGTVAPPPEGAVLPQTYDYTLNTPRTVILHRAERAEVAALAQAWTQRDQAVNLSQHEALVLASIVQEETPLAAELPKVAAVYENRLAKGMKLQADPTVIFAASGGAVAAGVEITRSDLENPSLYNTYAHAGLPPGAICAPGLAALNAVLHPAVSDDLYFVATGSGGHVFSRTYKGQLANVAAYRAAVGH